METTPVDDPRARYVNMPGFYRQNSLDLSHTLRTQTYQNNMTSTLGSGWIVSLTVKQERLPLLSECCFCKELIHHSSIQLCNHSIYVTAAAEHPETPLLVSHQGLGAYSWMRTC